MHFSLSLCDDSSDLGTKSVDDSAELETTPTRQREGMPVAQLDDILSEMKDVKSDLLQVMELVGILVRRERCAETKAEIATRRLDRMEQERDQESEAECEATLEEALTNQSKVVTNGLSTRAPASAKPRQGRSSSSTPAQCRVLTCLRSALTRGCKW